MEKDQNPSGKTMIFKELASDFWFYLIAPNALTNS